jgi:hypothetical protein
VGSGTRTNWNSGLRWFTGYANFYGLVWAAEQIMLPKMGVAPPITESPSEEIAIDAWHHFVYAQAVSTAYDALFSRAPNRT